MKRKKGSVFLENKIKDIKLRLILMVLSLGTLRVAGGPGGRSLLDSLSMRELQVLRRLALGHTNREIAESYHISIKTVDTYRSRLLKKFDLRNNTELSRFAIQNRIIEA
jgi:two-component system invasion response regulator UvrY